MFASGVTYEALGNRLKNVGQAFGHGIARRYRLLKGNVPENAHAPPLRLLLAELATLGEPVARQFRKRLDIAPAADPKVVILLPGFATNAMRMRYMAIQLERAGHKVKRWGLGWNLGPTPEKFDILSERVCSVRKRYGKDVVLVGWSLGGLFAREIAKRHPDCVAKVVTMGTPFSHTPYSNNLWRTYQFVAGHRVDELPIPVSLREKPPVETVALWSPRDGAISHRAAAGCPGERDRAVAVRCSHIGFCNSPEAIKAVLLELDRE